MANFYRGRFDFLLGRFDTLSGRFGFRVGRFDPDTLAIGRFDQPPCMIYGCRVYLVLGPIPCFTVRPILIHLRAADFNLRPILICIHPSQQGLISTLPRAGETSNSNQPYHTDPLKTVSRQVNNMPTHRICTICTCLI